MKIISNAFEVDGVNHPQVLIWGFGFGEARVDAGIARDILKLWRRGIATYYSCQGYGTRRRGRYVMVKKRCIDEVAKLLPWVEVVDKHPNIQGYYALRGKKSAGTEDYSPEYYRRIRG